MSGSTKSNVLSYLWAWINTIVIVGTPIVLIPLIVCFENDPTLKDPMRCAYVLILMILLWTTESLPLAITALLPMVLYPLMNLVKATELAPQYMAESNISFVGSILVIGTFERVGLHKLFALRVLTLVGAQPRWLLSGFMLVAWFLSMWTSNTMTTILLVPIVLSVSTELRNAMEAATTAEGLDLDVGNYALTEMASLPPPPYLAPPPVYNNYNEVAMTDFSAKPAVDDEIQPVSPQTQVPAPVITPELKQEVSHHKYENMLLLAIAYSASIGGTATVIGTGPNLIMKQSVEETFESKGCISPLNFLSWMIFSVPMSLLFLIIMWLWLLIYFCGPLYTFGITKSPLDRHRKKIEATIRDIYKAIPPIDFEQAVVLGHCLLMICLLITRQLNSNPLIGWEIIAPGYVKESTATILVAISLFIFPIKLPYKDPTTGKWVPPKVAINWSQAEKNFPFGLLLLIGGGMAAAYGADKSGLAALLAGLLNDLISGLEDVLALLIVLIFMVFVTEFMSNTACVTLMMPILKLLAEHRGSNPMLFMFPTALAASFAFMFPVATPPNALVFQTGKFRIIDMIMAGFVVNVIGIGVIFFASTTYGAAYFHLYEMPWTVEQINGTTVYTCIY